jgi:hypothetical protein
MRTHGSNPGGDHASAGVFVRELFAGGGCTSAVDLQAREVPAQASASDDRAGVLDRDAGGADRGGRARSPGHTGRCIDALVAAQAAAASGGDGNRAHDRRTLARRQAGQDVRIIEIPSRGHKPAQHAYLRVLRDARAKPGHKHALPGSPAVLVTRVRPVSRRPLRRCAASTSDHSLWHRISDPRH